LLNAERFKSKDLRARDERAVHIEERIVSSRANQAEASSFDIGQKNVLLGFVEMMDLIDEQDRLLSGRAEAIRRRSDDAAHLGNVAFHATDSNEFSVGHLGNDPCQCGLSASGRAGEDHRRQAIGFNRAPQQFTGAKNVFLADKLLQRAGSHARGERRCAVRGFNVFLFLE
jgi:hypothetical protein